MTDEIKSSVKDYKSHFVNWFKYNKQDAIKNSGSYKWKWKGQSTKSGTKTELEKDRAFYDQDGFDFKIIQNGH